MSFIQMFRASDYKACVTRERATSRRGAPPVKRHGASFGLDGVPAPYILIDCDEPPINQNATRCDFVFVADGNDGCIAPIEMTAGKKKTSDAVSQLRAGAELVAEVVHGRDVTVFRPVLVGRLKEKRQSKKGLRKSDRDRVLFGGRRYRVRSVANGGMLNSVFITAGD